jgi:hypothetical protein
MEGFKQQEKTESFNQKKLRSFNMVKIKETFVENIASINPEKNEDFSTEIIGKLTTRKSYSLIRMKRWMEGCMVGLMFLTIPLTFFIIPFTLLPVNQLKNNNVGFIKHCFYCYNLYLTN